ncbi:hypothetical protein ACLQ2O_38145 [Kribbella sp. DT2]
MVVHDRPETGQSVAVGNLTTAARDVHRVVEGFDPVLSRRVETVARVTGFLGRAPLTRLT